MKNMLLLFILLLPLSFSSCSKDDEENTSSDLAGSIWKSDDNEKSIEFVSKTAATYKWVDHSGSQTDDVTEEGIYTVNGKNVHFDFGDYDMTGAIEGASMTCSWGSRVFVVKKQ